MLFTTIVRLHRTEVMGIEKGSEHCRVHGLQGEDPDFYRPQGKVIFSEVPVCSRGG